MIISEYINNLQGMSLEEGLSEGYRTENGSLSSFYLFQITACVERVAMDFEIALKAFHYNFPLDGKYKIYWKIERIDDDNQ